MAGAEVEDSSYAVPLPDAFARPRQELGVDALSERPANPAREGFVADRETRLEHERLERGNVKGRTVHLLVGQYEILNALRDGMPRRAHANGFAVGRFAPSSLQVPLAFDDGLEWLRVVAGVQADEPHSVLANALGNSRGKGGPRLGRDTCGPTRTARRCLQGPRPKRPDQGRSGFPFSRSAFHPHRGR